MTLLPTITNCPYNTHPVNTDEHINKTSHGVPPSCPVTNASFDALLMVVVIEETVTAEEEEDEDVDVVDEDDDAYIGLLAVIITNSNNNVGFVIVIFIGLFIIFRGGGGLMTLDDITRGQLSSHTRVKMDSSLSILHNSSYIVDTVRLLLLWLMLLCFAGTEGRRYYTM